MDKTTGWGKICVGTRLEKQVIAEFMVNWTALIQQGLRKGDAVAIITGKVAHMAANDLVRAFLHSKCDTLLMLDSDALFGPQFLNEFRDFEDGWKYDALQAFYPRRGWPPQAIWFKRGIDGSMYNCLVRDEITEDVDGLGTHAVLIRREVFERLLGDNDPKDFDWFYYPRHGKTSEDMAFAQEAKAAGFRLGATSVIKTGHYGTLTTDWSTYQEYLRSNPAMLEQAEELQQRDGRIVRLAEMVAEYTGLPYDTVIASVRERNVAEVWQKLKPSTPADVRLFYGYEANNYLFDLIRWNAGEKYLQITEPLTDVSDSRVLVIGAGLGQEIAALVDWDNQIDVFELPGALRMFQERRFAGNSNVRHLKGNTLPLALDGQAPYDVIVAIDVIEHVHPDEIDNFLASLATVVHAGTKLVIHNNFGQQDVYPMHYDHSRKFDAWLSAIHAREVSHA